MAHDGMYSMRDYFDVTDEGDIQPRTDLILNPVRERKSTLESNAEVFFEEAFRRYFSLIQTSEHNCRAVEGVECSEDEKVNMFNLMHLHERQCPNPQQNNGKDIFARLDTTIKEVICGFAGLEDAEKRSSSNTFSYDINWISTVTSTLEEILHQEINGLGYQASELINDIA